MGPSGRKRTWHLHKKGDQAFLKFGRQKKKRKKKQPSIPYWGDHRFEAIGKEEGA